MGTPSANLVDLWGGGGSIYMCIYGSPPPIDPYFFGLYNLLRQDWLSISTPGGGPP